MGPNKSRGGQLTNERDGSSGTRRVVGQEQQENEEGQEDVHTCKWTQHSGDWLEQSPWSYRHNRYSRMLLGRQQL